MTTTSGQPAAPFTPSPARLRPRDLAGLASVGLRTRKLRAGLSALGIAIGVAAIVAVLGLAASAQAALLTEIARLGTNLLTVSNGTTFSGATAELPQAAPGMIARLPGVIGVQDTGTVGNVSVYKSPLIPPIETNALSVDAATLGLPSVAGTSLAQGRFLNAATAREPVAVLGATSAQLLGIDRVRPGMRIWAGGQWFYVTGILNQDTYAPEIDSAVLVGFPAAEKYLHFDGHPSGIYVRTVDTPAATTRIDSLLGAQASPENPSQVNVSQPSDALTARADAQGALDTLFLGLGAVALLVGAIGVANIMVISVLERRSEIGLRRALGATRGQIRVQFLSEAILLSVAGGAAGVLAGAAATARLRPRPRRDRRHPTPGLGRRPGCGGHHRCPGRAAARHPRRPPVTDPGTPDRLTGQSAGGPPDLPSPPGRARSGAGLAVGVIAVRRVADQQSAGGVLQVEGDVPGGARGDVRPRGRPLLAGEGDRDRHAGAGGGDPDDAGGGVGGRPVAPGEGRRAQLRPPGRDQQLLVLLVVVRVDRREVADQEAVNPGGIRDLAHPRRHRHHGPGAPGSGHRGTRDRGGGGRPAARGGGGPVRRCGLAAGQAGPGPGLVRAERVPGEDRAGQQRYRPERGGGDLGPVARRPASPARRRGK